MINNSVSGEHSRNSEEEMKVSGGGGDTVMGAPSLHLWYQHRWVTEDRRSDPGGHGVSVTARFLPRCGLGSAL